MSFFPIQVSHIIEHTMNAFSVSPASSCLQLRHGNSRHVTCNLSLLSLRMNQHFFRYRLCFFRRFSMISLCVLRQLQLFGLISHIHPLCAPNIVHHPSWLRQHQSALHDRFVRKLTFSFRMCLQFPQQFYQISHF